MQIFNKNKNKPKIKNGNLPIIEKINAELIKSRNKKDHT